MADHVTVIPSARRLMGSLRAMGYDAPTAIAELIDNSIDACATEIEITIRHHGEHSWLRVVDDGVGMTARRLDEAMRYGSRRGYGDEDLGAFGLGLKTGSLSQCRTLSVASRTTPKGRWSIRRWDLDRVAAHDQWRLERLAVRGAPAELVEPLRGRSGTSVLWQRLDRVSGYARPDGAAAGNAVESLAAEVEQHVGMVFHRFLEGRRGELPLTIRINGLAVQPWDPFARDEEATERLPVQSIRLRDGARVHRIRVRPYILPNQSQFSTPDAHAAAAGPNRWNRQQGLYIYRRDRLIQSGGWNRLRTLDEHSKLARMSLDIPPEADEAFRVNVSKMRVTLPVQLRPRLRTLISGVVARAQDVYRQRVRLLEGGAGPSRSGPGEGAGWRVANEWPLITEILERELAGHPELLDRVLLALANAKSTSAAA
jgi:hypothetical protein